MFDFVRYLYLCIVTDKLTHSSPKSDVIFLCMTNFLEDCMGYIRDQGIFANKDLGHHDTRVNGWGIREDGICGYSLISSGNVKCWKPRFEMFSHGESSRCDCPLSRVFKCFLDSISINPTKIRSQLIVVNGGRFLSMLLVRSDGFFREYG